MQPLQNLLRWTTLAGASLIAASALAQTPMSPISVADPYVRAPAPNAPATGAFMVIKNGGKADRKVVKAESPVSKVTELHTHVEEGGVMKMRPVPEIAVRAGGEAVLKPGSLHVMLIDLKQPLKEGDVVPITLGLDDGSSLKVEAPVKKLPTTMPAPPAAQR
jgi:periplasmic copper chaperone A